MSKIAKESPLQSWITNQMGNPSSERILTRGYPWLCRHSAISVSLVATAFVLAGCAAESESHQVAPSISALAPGDGRIYFYRTAALPTEVFPRITLNGQDVGAVKPHTFFYVDRPPGDYKVETSDAEPPGHWNFSLAKGQSQYVRIDLSGMEVWVLTREFAILIVTLPFTVIGAPLYNGGRLTSIRHSSTTSLAKKKFANAVMPFPIETPSSSVRQLRCWNRSKTGLGWSRSRTR